ncbi:AAA family ATPase [bacterium]|nr:AAA family ATPase [bacterium]
MKYDNTLVINLIGGPCSGKSTIASELFARLKKMGIKCELVSEYIKDRIYEENKTIVYNQIAIFGMEHYNISNKIGKVDVIVHDGSFINNTDDLYNCEQNPEFNTLIVSEYKKFNNLDFFIKRGNIEFEDYGRIHNLEQSKELDQKIKDTYHKYGLSFIEVEARDAVDKIIPIVLKKLENN